MSLSVVLIVISLILLAVPQLNQVVDVWVKSIPFVNRVRAPAATLIAIAGLLGLMMGWY